METVVVEQYLISICISPDYDYARYVISRCYSGGICSMSSGHALGKNKTVRLRDERLKRNETHYLRYLTPDFQSFARIYTQYGGQSFFMIPILKFLKVTFGSIGHFILTAVC